MKKKNIFVFVEFLFMFCCCCHHCCRNECEHRNRFNTYMTHDNDIFSLNQKKKWMMDLDHKKQFRERERETRKNGNSQEKKRTIINHLEWDKNLDHHHHTSYYTQKYEKIWPRLLPCVYVCRKVFPFSFSSIKLPFLLRINNLKRFCAIIIIIISLKAILICTRKKISNE